MIDLQTLLFWFQEYGYLAVFSVLLLCGFGFPIPEDISLVAGGVLAGLGANLYTMLLLCFAGVLLGDITMFTLGRFFGPRILQKRLVRRIITPERYADIQRRFEEQGLYLLFVARFMPGLRAPIFMIAGITNKISYIKFISIDGFAALISVPVWVILGYLGAKNLEHLQKNVMHGQQFIFLFLVVGIISYLGIRYWRKKRNKS